MGSKHLIKRQKGRTSAEYQRIWRERYPEYNKHAMQEWRKKNPERFRAIQRKAHTKHKTKVFDHYGRVCKMCGFSDERALSIDHINGNGNNTEKKLKPLIFMDGCADKIFRLIFKPFV